MEGNQATGTAYRAFISFCRKFSITQPKCDLKSTPYPNLFASVVLAHGRKP